MHTSRTDGWATVWHADDFPLAVERIILPDRTARHRITTGNGRPGAIAVVVNEDSKILFVSTKRIAIGEVFLELPRGFADPVDTSALAAAARETLEETGYETTVSQPLADIYPDTGLLSGKVHVTLLRTRRGAPVRSRDEEALSMSWLDGASVGRYLAAGVIRDGLTLAALMVARRELAALGIEF